MEVLVVINVKKQHRENHVYDNKPIVETFPSFHIQIKSGGQHRYYSPYLAPPALTTVYKLISNRSSLYSVYHHMMAEFL